jgi:hypothetical protein
MFGQFRRRVRFGGSNPNGGRLRGEPFRNSDGDQEKQAEQDTPGARLADQTIAALSQRRYGGGHRRD